MTNPSNHRTDAEQTAHDPSRRSHTEADDRLKELMTENARLRGDLLTIAGRICHDLRAPLGGIVISGEALKETVADGNSLASALVDSLLSSTDEIARLIKRLSFVTKASGSRIPLEPVAMGEVVSGVLQQLERRILENGASVTTPDSWPEVSGVSACLETIWSDLLANALQHAGKAPKIELGWHREGEHFRFWISDNGSGVPEAKRQKLFQHFHSLHQLDSSRGLGLSIVQRLVELQGGDCGYESSGPGGACFFFTLPAPRIS